MGSTWDGTRITSTESLKSTQTGKYSKIKRQEKNLLLFPNNVKTILLLFLKKFKRAILTPKMREYCSDDMELRKATMMTVDDLSPGSDEPLGDFEDKHLIYMPYVPVPGESVEFFHTSRLIR